MLSDMLQRPRLLISGLPILTLNSNVATMKEKDCLDLEHCSTDPQCPFVW